MNYRLWTFDGNRSDSDLSSIIFLSTKRNCVTVGFETAFPPFPVSPRIPYPPYTCGIWENRVNVFQQKVRTSKKLEDLIVAVHVLSRIWGSKSWSRTFPYLQIRRIFASGLSSTKRRLNSHYRNGDKFSLRPSQIVANKEPFLARSWGNYTDLQ